MTKLHWVKCTGGVWCDLQKVHLPSIHDEIGVYVIWHTGTPGRVIRVGQGNIVQRQVVINFQLKF